MPGKRLTSKEEIQQVFQNQPRIAMMGASKKPQRPAHRIFKYLRAQGLDVIPVNPGGGEVDGVPMVLSLAEIDGPVDIVNVFRNPRDLDLSLVDESLKLGARVLWLQDGVVHEEIAQAALQAGLDLVMDDCIYRRHRAMF